MTIRPAYHLIVVLMLFVITGCRKDKDPLVDGVKPVITAVSPLSGPKGTVLTISGSGFSSVLSENNVYINGKPAVLVSASEFQIKCTVEPKTGSGLVSVAVNGNGASGPVFDFVYTITVSIFSGQPQNPGFADGFGGSAQFHSPRGIAIDDNENLYVADELNNRIRLVSPGGNVSTFCGSGLQGHADGSPGIARFNSPYDIELDEINGNFYVADNLNHCIRKITMAGDVFTVAGIPGSPGFVDAPGQSARLNAPTGVALEGEVVNVYIADAGNHCIRRMDAAEVVTTFAGSAANGQQDGIGTAARFSFPYDICWDSSGFLFVTDMINENVRRITKSTREVITVAGVGTSGFMDGQGVFALFHDPAGISAVNGEVVLCDMTNNRIRTISAGKNVTTIAGNSASGYLNGAGAQAQFNRPGGIVRNKEGDFFISDTQNHCIRKIVVD